MKSKSQHPSELCERFARILDSTPSVVNGVCTAVRSRSNIHPVVLGRKAESLMFLPHAFSFESMDSEGRALCIGETVVLQKEINPFISVLREHGIIVNAIHNHWLFDKPRLMYMHFESIDEPLSFARKVRDAVKELTTDQVGAAPKVHTHEFDVTGLCDKFNDLLGGTIHTVENGICTVMGLRTEINAVVLG
ncbi:MAG TPA: DUF1259 domain-containing protein, partial [Bacillales bacterium]